MIINPGIGLNSQFQQTVPVPLDASLDRTAHILITISSQSIKRARLVDVASEVSSPAKVCCNSRQAIPVYFLIEKKWQSESWIEEFINRRLRVICQNVMHFASINC